MLEVMVTYPIFVCRSVKSPVSKSTVSYCRDDTSQTLRQVTLQGRISGWPRLAGCRRRGSGMIEGLAGASLRDPQSLPDVIGALAATVSDARSRIQRHPPLEGGSFRVCPY